MTPFVRPHHLDPRLETARVILVHHGYGAASRIGLGISTNYTAKTLRANGVWAETWPAQSGAVLAERLRRVFARAVAQSETRPTHVVIAALWVPTAELQALAIEFSEVVFAVVSHSHVAFLNADPGAIRMLREAADLQLATHNVVVGGNSKNFTDWATKAWGINVAWLPNLYDTSEVFPRTRIWESGTPLRIGILGANRTLKNVLTAAAAAVQLAAEFNVPVALYVSIEPNDGGSLEALHQLTQNIPNLTLIERPWLPWSEFRRFVRTLDIVITTSYTESFHVISADAIAEGVPTATSEVISWLPHWWRAPADNPMEIARVAAALLRDPHASEDGRRALRDYIDRGLLAWKHFLAP